MSPSATRRPQRIDWHSMMMTEDDPIKIPTPRLGTPARMGTPRISTPARIPTPMPAHTQSEAAVFYQFLEAHEDHPAAPTPTDVWHNPAMHVDPHLDADAAYSSLPHWAWAFED